MGKPSGALNLRVGAEGIVTCDIGDEIDAVRTHRLEASRTGA